MKYKILFLCLFVLAIPTVMYLYVVAQPDTVYLQNANYQLMKDMYDLYTTPSATIVMLGDSHTFNVDWNELLGRKDIANRGIHGDILPGFRQRLGQVTKLTPRYCFVMGGINDLYANYSVSQIISNYKKLLEDLREKNIVPIIQSTLPVATTYQQAEQINAQVREINSALREYAQEEHLCFLDISSLLAKDNTLRSELSYDGLHLNAKGYALWRNEVEQTIRTLGI